MNDRHEKIIKRSDGTRVKIIVSFVDYGEDSYDISVFVCKKGKRKFVEILDLNPYPYRHLPHSEKVKKNMEEYLKFVSRDEIHEAKVEMWEKLKPEDAI